jgi:excinuclease UvrABC ATPase subunit
MRRERDVDDIAVDRTPQSIDLGLDAGHDGGRIVFAGAPAAIVAARSTLTGTHLAGFVRA